MPDINGITPLMLALKVNNINNAGFLIAKGADLWAKDSKNQTVIDYAKQNPHTLTYLHTEMFRAQYDASRGKHRPAMAVD